MDSSRGGLLSTLLMTLPLIVVPALALLRQPGGLTGVSTSPLDASDESADLDEFADELFDTVDNSDPPDSDPRTSPRAPDNDDEEIDAIFSEVPADDEPDFDLHRSAPEDPFAAGQKKVRRDSGDRDDSPAVAGDDSGSSSAEQKILRQLRAHGALRTLWFEPSESHPVGLAVFFRGQTDLVRIRFEAVGRTREECARDILRQVERWRKERLQNGADRAEN